MIDDTPAIDAETYQRATGLFQNKRTFLPPERVQLLASEVVHRLSQLGRPAIIVEAAKIDTGTVDDSCNLLLRQDTTAPLSFIAELQRRGASPQTLRYGLIAGAARRLGERWDRDEIGFMDVTIATGRLYGLIRAIKADNGDVGESDRADRRALFASVPGETHTIGISLAAETFRDAGWEIDLQISETHDDLIDHVTATKPMVIGLSLSSERRLPDLIRLVLALRIVAPLSTIGVAPALDMPDDEIFGLVDVDLIFRDARRALNDLERLSRLRQ